MGQGQGQGQGGGAPAGYPRPQEVQFPQCTTSAVLVTPGSRRTPALPWQLLWHPLYVHGC